MQLHHESRCAHPKARPVKCARDALERGVEKGKEEVSVFREAVSAVREELDSVAWRSVGRIGLKVWPNDTPGVRLARLEVSPRPARRCADQNRGPTIEEHT